MMLQLIKKYLKTTPALFLLIAIFITSIWFREEKLIASGEESLSLFNTRDIWKLNGIWEEIGFGLPNPTYLPRIPISYIIQLLHLFIPLWLAQATIFVITIFIGITSMYYCVQELQPEDKKYKKISFFSSLFYFFNIYAMTQIWGRFLYAAIGTWAYLPLFLLLWIRWIRTGSILWLAIFALSAIPFSIIFVQPATLFVLFPPLFLWTLMLIIKYRHNALIFKQLLLTTFIGLLFYGIANLYWIIPYARLIGETFVNVAEKNASFDSLRGVSPYFTVTDIITLRQKYLLSESAYSNWYNTSLAVQLSWITTIIVAIGAIFYYKKTRKLFLPILFILSLFIVKGSNPPLGYAFYQALFSNFPVTQVLRNPYEKFGVVFLFSYAIFFGYGMYWLWSTLYIKTFIPSLMVIVCGILVWPIWTGDLFGGRAFNTRIQIPQYYSQINSVINKDISDTKILMLPMLGGDGISLDWGYHGVEPSEYIFDKTVIGKIYRTYSDKKYLELYNAFKNNKDVESQLQQANIGYLIVREDIQAGSEISAQQSVQTLQNIPSITKIQTNGKLSLYKFKNNNPSSIEIQSAQKLNVKLIKKSATKYTISVNNAVQPYTLILKQTFNGHWKAKINQQLVTKHYEIYNYANAWDIDKKGNYEIQVSFEIL